MALRLRSFFLCLAVACLCVLSLGSLTAHAMIDETDFVAEEIEIEHSAHYAGWNSEGKNYYSAGRIRGTGLLSGNTTDYRVFNSFSYSNVKTYAFIDRFYIKNNAKDSLVPIGNDYLFTISGLTNTCTWTNKSTGSTGDLVFQDEGVIGFNIFAFDVGGKYVRLENADVKVTSYDDGTYSVVARTGSVPFEVYELEVDVVWEFDDGYADSNSDYASGKYSYYRSIGFTGFSFSWYGNSPLVSLNEQLIKSSKSILDNVKDIGVSITELPSNVWSVFEEGLTNLFVPDDEAISDMQEDWNNLLADRFGALYQVGDLVTDFADAFKESEQKTVTLPSITVPVGADGWTFGGWEIQLVPDGMEVLFTTLKTLVSIVATFLFINGLKRRFEGLIGGAPTA